MFKEIEIIPLESYIELRKATYLEKLAHMNSKIILGKLLVDWLACAQNKGNPKQTIKHAEKL